MEGYGNENPGAFQPTRPLRGATKSQQKPRKAFLFQPTRPLRGATSSPWPQRARTERFQPTRPLRGATISVIINTFLHLNFNPRAPCGARHFATNVPTPTNVFQPTRPLRGATGGEASDYDKFQISTHAPLAGRDAESERLSYEIADFNPRAPCGARHEFARK